MAAATTTYPVATAMIPNRVITIKLSSMTSDQTETITHLGPGTPVSRIRWTVTKPPTALCPVVVEHIKANDTTTTSDVKVLASEGGDLAGCEIELEFIFTESASGGIS